MVDSKDLLSLQLLDFNPEKNMLDYIQIICRMGQKVTQKFAPVILSSETLMPPTHVLTYVCNKLSYVFTFAN